MIRLLRGTKNGLKSLIGLPWRVTRPLRSRLPWWTSPRGWLRFWWRLISQGYVRFRGDPYFRLRMVLYAGAGVLMMVALVAFAIPMSSNGAFCGACHSNTPNYTTLLESSHARVICYACHEPPSAFVIIKAKMIAPKDVLKELLGRAPDPINPGSHLATLLPSENCMRCHNMKTRKFTPRSGVLMDHEKHLDLGINCTRCHNRIAHLGKEGYPQWMSMAEGCFRCHTVGRLKYVQGGVVENVDETELDATLHEDVRELEDEHKEEQHHSIENLLEGGEGVGGHAGAVGVAGVALASSEEETAAGHEVEEEVKIDEAPRACETCHPPEFNLRPRNHNRDVWAPEAIPVSVSKRTEWSHAKLAKDTEVIGCYECHQKVFCLDCHGMEMPHEKPFFDRHGKVVLATIKPEPKTVFFADFPFTLVKLQKTSVAVVKDDKNLFCYRCHAANQFCQECHGVSFPHPNTWKRQHGDVAKAKLPNSFPVGEELRGKLGREACRTCHREQFCSECHGGVEMPHNKQKWLGNHVFFLKSHSAQNCLNCHRKNECERCHSVHNVHIQQQLYDFSKTLVPGARK